MKLTPENIYQYLHKRQLIDEASVVKGHFMVEPVKTRNNIMKVIVRPENSLFVKQAEKSTLSDSMLQREVFANNLLKNNAEFAAIAAIVPAMIDHDTDNNVIVTQLWPGAKNITEYYWLTKTFDTNLARGQARILSACHTVPDAATDTSVFPKALPWILQTHQFDANQFFVDNPASTSIIKLIKDNPLLQKELINLADSWKATYLIHGDIKWINFLVEQTEGELRQTLIDWELADIGDPVWDVAGLLQSYIVAWVLSLDNSQPRHYQLPESLKHYEMKNMQLSAQAFLDEYLILRQFHKEDRGTFYIRVIQFTAARIIQTSLESVTYFTNIEANNMRLIQLAFNMLRNPEKCLQELFGIKLQPEYV